VSPDQIEQSLRTSPTKVKDKGPGGHILLGRSSSRCGTGRRAGGESSVHKAGDSLRLQRVRGPRIRGFLPDDYTYIEIKIISLDERRMVAKFAAASDSLHHFFGRMGDAPRESAGRFNSAPPWIMRQSR